VALPNSVDPASVVTVEQFHAENAEEAPLAAALFDQGVHFLQSFDWCLGVRETYVGFALGGVVAILLLRIEPDSPEVDEWLWVVVGDLPPAYLVTDDAPTPADALEGYLEYMEEWVDAVNAGRPREGLMPVLTAGGAEPIPATAEHAEMLASRVGFLRDRVLPEVTY
jgi:hypothetical protein